MLKQIITSNRAGGRRELKARDVDLDPTGVAVIITATAGAGRLASTGG